ncbi:nucleoside phosphatase family-domain-containing protein [Apodospora peruviana]|uniref:Nucleoside phosphatase family-domain-containing protein n=1 Tax=Apodospora peruviana TaxID=516989 RepID=A0AAE0M411_9PEZI|nr:nucleoside phosphatase family-domain-containing protein [Apodospora peruviana]
MADRRRINGPVGATLPPLFVDADEQVLPEQNQTRSRPGNTIRKMYLKTGVTPSASGSAYLEVETSGQGAASGLKLSCTVHGPRALPRSTPFSPHIILSTHVKYAPFATKQRHGYLRDPVERDLGTHLEAALRGAIIADRWPKSGVEIIVSIIEGDQDRGISKSQGDEAWDMMNALSGCITVASAALADAGIDCVDTVAGGVAALVRNTSDDSAPGIVVDPIPSEHEKIDSACCVAYLPTRDEVTNLWFKGDLPASDIDLYTQLIEKGIQASKSANRVLVECLRRYGVILDAGSSGTRLHIYQWKDPEKARHNAEEEELHSLPRLMTEKKWTKKIHPGIATFADKATEVGPDYLQSLVEHALRYIPKDKIRDTPIFLMATAGMRLLPKIQQSALTHEVCSYLRGNTQFSLPDCDLHIQVIKGETEGLYGWIASNYLLGGFDHPTEHAHGKGHHTYGFLDMGGASAQIAFAPNSTEAQKHADDLKLLRLRTLDGSPSEYKVFTTTWLGFGVNEARESYVENLKELYAGSKSGELPDPCMPKSLRTTLDGKPVQETKSDGLTLIGTGAFDECLRQTYPLLGKDKPCEDQPCLLNGQHVPAIDFDVNHFVGVSEYWHTTHGVFGGKDDEAYDFTTYQKRVKDYCSQDWDSIQSTIDSRKKHDAKNAQEACFKASWLINILHEGIGVPRIGLETLPAPGLNASKDVIEDAKDKGFLDPFQPVDKIDGIEVSWTLGKMVLYAAGQIPPRSGDDKYPVGFGSNMIGESSSSSTIPPDFQFAGSSWRTIGHHGNQTSGDDDDWGSQAEDLLDKAKVRSASGVFIFLLIFFCFVYFFRKRDRRMRLYGRTRALFRSNSRKPSRFGGVSGGSRKGSGSLSGLIANTLFGKGRRSSGSGGAYERVMEEGDLNQFELGDVDSLSSFEENNDYSDSSADGGSSSSSSRRYGSSGSRFSGTPTLNLMGSGSGSGSGHGFETMPTTGSAALLDRSGLVVRTESRERLALPGGANLQMLNAGRRSRAPSPTRLKSPLMPPLQEK